MMEDGSALKNWLLRKSTVFLLIAMVFGMLISGMVYAAEIEDVKFTGKLEQRTSDGSMVPVASANITLYNNNDEPFYLMTDENGNYNQPMLAGTYIIHYVYANDEEFNGPFDQIDVDSSGSIPDIVLPAANVQGTVHDSDDTIAGSGYVEIRENSTSSQKSYNKKLKEDGTFKGYLPPGEYVISSVNIDSPDSNDSEEIDVHNVFTVTQNQTATVNVVIPTVTLTGAIQFKQVRTISQSEQVSLEILDPVANDYFWVHVNQDGSYTKRLAQGTYITNKVKVTINDYSNGSQTRDEYMLNQTIEIPAGLTSPVVANITVDNIPSVKGTISRKYELGSSAVRLSGAEVTLHTVGKEPGFEINTITNAVGEFSFAAMDGTYEILDIRLDNISMSRTNYGTVQVEDGKSQFINILIPANNVSGTVSSWARSNLDVSHCPFCKSFSISPSIQSE
jgi:hypothetical protein